jgi:soluble lytic murein transglycosylase-like protein
VGADDETFARWAGTVAGTAVAVGGAFWAVRAVKAHHHAQFALAQKLAQKWAGLFGVDPVAVLSIAGVESDFNPNTENHNDRAEPKGGAWGMMQILPGTAHDLVTLLKAGRGVQHLTAGPARHNGQLAVVGVLQRYDQTNARSLLDPELNVMLGAYYVARLAREFGDFKLVAAAYHQGPGKVRQMVKAGQAIPDNLPPFGKEYVALALARRAQLESGEVV